ncbi:hypothetical protein TNIN_146111 [Trichonephila inaurata madagascariensis]|uniref:Uncharacterized protein n=1 Tax=Trichonephila inaurata madagascariensis TaxID=2747483 RepID=A0A8X6YYA0_9ARAC|nr:hypothetical protein TNIN_146111 [Trichonephila inaurata madagascariensis]
MSPTAPPAYSSSTNMNRPPPKEGSLTLEEKRFLVAVERGDLASTRRGRWGFNGCMHNSKVRWLRYTDMYLGSEEVNEVISATKS